MPRRSLVYRCQFHWLNSYLPPLPSLQSPLFATDAPVPTFQHHLGKLPSHICATSSVWRARARARGRRRAVHALLSPPTARTAVLQPQHVIGEAGVIITEKGLV